MAKMYSHGEGVPVDEGKAEMLRNLAALQVFKKGDLTPGELRPANESVRDLSARLAYLEGDGNASKGGAPDIGKFLESIDLKGIVSAPKTGEEADSSSPGVSIEIPHEASPGTEPAPAAESPTTPPPAQSSAGRTMPEKQVEIAQDSRRSEQVSLGRIRDAASAGDPMAMQLLSEAYAKGFYGLTVSTAQATAWNEKFKEAYRLGTSPVEIDSLEKVPWVQVWSSVGAGLALMLLGVWLWR